jgi:hypothetical protein
MTHSIFEDLATACEIRGLRLELCASDKLKGSKGSERRELERIDIASADGRQVLISSLIVPGPSGGIDAAAAIALERLTTSIA